MQKRKGRNGKHGPALPNRRTFLGAGVGLAAASLLSRMSPVHSLVRRSASLTEARRPRARDAAGSAPWKSLPSVLASKT